ncbi:MAG TPA: ABC transporter ATP-binding protein [Burkholderiales bacterium]|nr:ABC transporter ATP-binding protein [Burkholderiales bacterium]
MSLQPTRNDAAQGAIRIDRLSVEFRRNGVATVAVKDIDLAIAPGEFVALLGPSGCGKSTLLNAIGGMVRPTRGGVRIDGAPVKEPSARCGVVFQQHSLFPWMTALGNVAFGPRMLGHASPEAVAHEFLDLVGLGKFCGAYPAHLSGGMQQRVGIARALATRPPVLLMDEPFGALDAQTRSIMQEELLKIWSELKTTVVFVTHDVDEALYLSDRIFAMTNSPGSIKEEIRVDLGRPRAADVALSERYGALHRRVHRLIREESLKVFNSVTS